MSARRFAIVTEAAGRWGLGDAFADLSGRVSWRRRLWARSGGDAEVGADGEDALVVWQAGAGVPAVRELLLLV